MEVSAKRMNINKLWCHPNQIRIMVYKTGDVLGIQTVLLASVPSLFIMLCDASQVHHKHLSSELFHLVVLLLIHKDIRLCCGVINIDCFMYVYKTYLQKAQRIGKGGRHI